VQLIGGFLDFGLIFLSTFTVLGFLLNPEFPPKKEEPIPNITFSCIFHGYQKHRIPILEY
jgi:hypothetical protein